MQRRSRQDDRRDVRADHGGVRGATVAGLGEHRDAGLVGVAERDQDDVGDDQDEERRRRARDARPAGRARRSTAPASRTRLITRIWASSRNPATMPVIRPLAVRTARRAVQRVRGRVEPPQLDRDDQHEPEHDPQEEPGAAVRSVGHDRPVAPVADVLVVQGRWRVGRDRRQRRAVSGGRSGRSGRRTRGMVPVAVTVSGAGRPARSGNGRVPSEVGRSGCPASYIRRRVASGSIDARRGGSANVSRSHAALLAGRALNEQSPLIGADIPAPCVGIPCIVRNICAARPSVDGGPPIGPYCFRSALVQ